MCNITIQEVAGIVDSNDALVSILVSGTVDDCKNIIVSIECGSGSSISREATIEDESWHVGFNEEEIKKYRCHCKEKIKVTAICEEKPNCNDIYDELLQCRQPSHECPAVNWTNMSFNGCNVDIEATLNSSGSYSANLTDSSGNVLDGVTGSGEQTLSHNGDHQGSETFNVIITDPGNCQGLSLPITINCECPNVQFDYELGECDENTCNLVVSATVESSSPYSASLRNADGASLDSFSGSDAHVLTHEGSYPTGTSQSFEIHIDSPSGCGTSSVTIDIPSETPEKCPKLSGINVDGCWPGSVQFEVEGTDLDTVESYHWDFGDGDTSSQGPTLSHVYSDNCPDGGEDCSFPVTVTITSPDGCEPTEQNASASVRKCITEVPPPPTLCWIWFWVNIGLFVGTAILIFLTGCLLEATAISAIAAIGSGGTLSAVWAALSALNVGMLIASIVLIFVTLASFILWIIICALGQMRDIICYVLTLLMSILSTLNAFSFVLAIILSLSGVVGCAIGAWIDVAWFSILMSITWFVGLFLGCFSNTTSTNIARTR